MPAANPSEEKERLRSTMRRELEEMVPVRAREAAAAIEARLRASRIWLEARELAVFASLAGEVDTEPIMRSATEDGKVILLPRVGVAATLEFALVDDLEGLVPGRFGVREPHPGCPARPLSGADLVLVPGLAFDRRGGRLGRGAGYYDRALARARAGRRPPICLGIGFALQVVARVPMTPLDIGLDGLVTEEEFLLVK